MQMPTKYTLAGRLSRIFLILACLMPAAGVLVSVSPVLAQKMYVQPSAEVPVRSGKGTEYKILSVVPDGIMVEIIEEEDPWVRIRTQGGTEGWMLKRYLSSQVPLSEAVASLKTQNAQLVDSNNELKQRLDEFTFAHTQSSEELNACIIERDEILREYRKLQEDTADVVNIKKQLAAASQEVQTAREELSSARRSNENLRRSIALKWFLAGGGVLLVGWLLGMLFGRSRGKKTSLY